MQEYPRPRLLAMVPANTRRLPNAVLMLVQRLRRWPNIEPVLGKYIVLLTMSLGRGVGWGGDIWPHFFLIDDFFVITRFVNDILIIVQKCTKRQGRSIHLPSFKPELINIFFLFDGGLRMLTTES